MGLTLRGVGGVAEDLPFDSGSFDAVVSTLVFCSVLDPSLALREVGSLAYHVVDRCEVLFRLSAFLPDSSMFTVLTWTLRVRYAKGLQH